MEAVELLLDVGERGAQLLHHAAHGLAVRHLAVQRFHPRFDGVGRCAGCHLLQAFRQAAHPLAQLGLVQVHFVERGVHAQHGGGHFHGQGRPGQAVGAARRAGGVAQGLRQALAFGVELPHRFGHQLGLLGHQRQHHRVAGRHAGPGLAEGRCAAACQRQLGRVDPTQRAAFVVQPGPHRQAQQAARLLQPRHGAAALFGRAGAEEAQVLQQALGTVRRAALAGAQLGQQARGHAAGVVVRGKGAGGLGLEEGRGQLPQLHRRGRGTGRQAGTQLAQALQWRRVARCAQAGQHGALQCGSGVGVQGPRRGGGRPGR